MKPKQIFSRFFFLLSPVLAAAVLLGACGSKVSARDGAREQSGASAKSSAPPQQLNPEGQTALRTILEAGNLAELRWPNFSVYD